MATTKRRASLTKQLKAATDSLAEQAALNEKLQRELASAKSSSDSWYKQLTEYKQEIEQVHTLIDALPGSISRKSEPQEYGSVTHYALMTRLAAWLAVRGA